ncbi:MAG TPA: hypothetical protein DDW90_02335 [Cyanobacteria bacterium UBA9971]|nr:hypothetical protein [Cyanobacteria bacterium UBA9971]
MNINLIEMLCPICQDKQDITQLYPANFSYEDFNINTFTARRIDYGCHYRIVKCKCGMVFSTPILSEEIINKLYFDSDFTYEEEVKNIQKSYLKVLKKLFNKSLNGLSVLEFGCGNGFFLEKLLKEGIKEVKGIEPSLKAVLKANPLIKEFLLNDIIENANLKTDYFDIVCSFHTLDHVRNPLSSIKKSYDLCKKGGVSFFITHDVDALQAKILKDKSPVIDIEHIYLFNKSTLKKLLEEAGFKDIKVVDIKNYYSLNYWIKMFPFPKLLKDNIIKIIKYLKIDDLNLGIKAGNIAILGYKY